MLRVFKTPQKCYVQWMLAWVWFKKCQQSQNASIFTAHWGNTGYVTQNLAVILTINIWVLWDFNYSRSCTEWLSLTDLFLYSSSSLHTAYVRVIGLVHWWPMARGCAIDGSVICRICHRNDDAVGYLPDVFFLNLRKEFWMLSCAWSSLSLSPQSFTVKNVYPPLSIITGSSPSTWGWKIIKKYPTNNLVSQNCAMTVQPPSY